MMDIDATHRTRAAALTAQIAHIDNEIDELREARKSPVEELSKLVGPEGFDGDLESVAGQRVHLKFTPGAKVDFTPEFFEVAQVAVSCGHDVYTHKPDLDAVKAIGDADLRDRLLRCVVVRTRSKDGKPLSPSIKATLIGDSK